MERGGDFGELGAIITLTSVYPSIQVGKSLMDASCLSCHFRKYSFHEILCFSHFTLLPFFSLTFLPLLSSRNIIEAFLGAWYYDAAWRQWDIWDTPSYSYFVHSTHNFKNTTDLLVSLKNMLSSSWVCVSYLIWLGILRRKRSAWYIINAQVMLSKR